MACFPRLRHRGDVYNRQPSDRASDSCCHYNILSIPISPPSK
nr:MAG TPA: hypothetical protein [Caudoviricetes sp.]